MSVPTESPAGVTAIRPFTIPVTPEAEIEALRARIAATRWPEKEPVDDLSQGVQLAAIQALARYWETEYDFGRLEARLSGLPQFMTEIDGLDIHFIHVRSTHDDALPLIITHGWPGSIVEMLNVIGPLTDPAAHGGSAEDAFHVVIPSMPGYGARPGGWRRTRAGKSASPWTRCRTTGSRSSRSTARAAPGGWTRW
jgi:Epoxide hydrolase N terminus